MFKKQTETIKERRTVEDTSNFTEQSTDPFRTLRNFDVEELLDGQRVTQLIGH